MTGPRRNRSKSIRQRLRNGLSRLLQLESRDVPAIIVVNSIGDAGAGTLRDAITTANTNAQADTITFNLGTFPATISLATELDEITENDLLIDGWSHAGFAGTPMVEIDGSLIGNAMRIKASNVTVRGLAINRATNDGVQIYGPVSNIKLVGNYIGVDLAGGADLGNNSSGIALFDNTGTPTNVTIGGTGTNERNLISGNNGQGIYIGGNGTKSVSIVGNFIGVDATGKVVLGNNNHGIMIDNDVTGVTVGGPGAGQFNLIGGNGQAGVYLQGGKTTGNTIEGNIIGTDTGLTLDLGNNNRGIWLNNGTNLNTIRGNVVAANSSDGILGENGAAKNTIVGNQLGFNSAAGIAFNNAPSNIIGGPNLADRNYFGANRDGIWLNGNSFGTLVQNNWIGVFPDGTTAAPNTEQGIEIGGSSLCMVLNNLIANSKSHAIEVRDGSDVTTIQGNVIGLNAAGAVAPNGNGVLIRNDSEGATVGGSLSSQRNVISGNTGTGVIIQDTNSPPFQVVQWQIADGGNDHYYVLTPSSLWANAQKAAVAAGGYLATIGDAAENAFLLTVRDLAGSDPWIGLTDDPAFGGTEFGNTSGGPNQGEGFVWADGTTTAPYPGGYANWNAGEPNNFGAGENYIQLTGGGGWNDNGNISLRTVMEFTSPPDLTKLASAFNLTTTVQNNYIGVDATGTKAVPNGSHGVFVQNYNGGSVGGVSVTGNVISGNAGQGVRVFNVGGQIGLFQWTTGTGANNHYYVVGPNTSWRNAEQAAVATGGHLASIGDADEQAFVQTNVLPFAGGATVWIGFTDANDYGQEFGNTSGGPNQGEGWVWTDGTPAPYPVGGPLTGYQNWNGGEPNNAGNEDFAEMVGSGGWNDLPSNAARRSLFEYTSLPDLNALMAALQLKTNITNNLIGTDATGATAIPNAIGMNIDSSSGVVVTGNTIAGNTGAGVNIVRGGANRVQGNFIGTNSGGTVNLANGSNGVTIAEGTGNTIGSNFDGKNDAAEANTIRFNKGAGISVEVSKLPTFQWTTGTGANNHYYVLAGARTWLASRNNAVAAGGDLASIASAEENQFIFANLRSLAGADIWIGATDDDVNFGTQGAAEFGNTSGAFNQGEGWIWTDGTPPAYPIGGPLVGYQNWGGGEPNDAGGEDYATLRGDGMWNDLPATSTAQAVMEFVTPPDFISLAANYPQQPTIFNSVRGNSISSNVGLGIDLGGNGPTANDVGDPDVGPNTLINFPVLTAATAGAATTVSGTYNSLASQKFNLDFYASASGNQGERYLGSTQVTTDASGNVTFTGVVLPSATVGGEVITATATDLNGNSSEFSAALTTGATGAAKVANVKIDDGTAQRSLVRSLTVTFDQKLDPTLDASAFSLTRQGGGSVTLKASVDNTGPTTVATLTFIGGDVDFISLKNGRYNFTIDASKATTGGGTVQLDGDNNGTAGGNYVLNSAASPATPTNIWRFFGDSDGDNDVDATDFAQLRLFYGGGTSIFDFDNDGDTDTSDFGTFRANYGGSI